MHKIRNKVIEDDGVLVLTRHSEVYRRLWSKAVGNSRQSPAIKNGVCMRASLSFVLILPLMMTFSKSTHAEFSLAGTMFEHAASGTGIDPLLLYAIALTESKHYVGDGLMAPHPYVFRSNVTGPRYFKSKDEAKLALSELLTKTNNVDVGMMQINLKYHPQPEPLKLLDPLYSLEVATRYLSKTLQSTDDLQIAIGRYHSWTEDLASGYGHKVLYTYQFLKKLSVDSK